MQYCLAFITEVTARVAKKGAEMDNKRLDQRLLHTDSHATARLTRRQVPHATNSYLPLVAALLENNADAPFPLRLTLLDTTYRRREISLPIDLS